MQKGFAPLYVHVPQPVGRQRPHHPLDDLEVELLLQLRGVIGKIGAGLPPLGAHFAPQVAGVDEPEIEFDRIERAGWRHVLACQPRGGLGMRLPPPDKVKVAGVRQQPPEETPVQMTLCHGQPLLFRPPPSVVPVGLLAPAGPPAPSSLTHSGMTFSEKSSNCRWTTDSGEKPYSIHQTRELGWQAAPGHSC